MKIKPIFTGKIVDGKFWMNDRKAFDSYVGSLGEGEYQITVAKRRKQRTSGQIWEDSNQNGYYWGVVIPKLVEYYAQLAEKENNPALKMTPDQVHEAIKFLFMNEGTFAKIPKIKSTSDLSTIEWESLMSQIRDWASEEYHIYIPEPYETTYPL